MAYPINKPSSLKQSKMALSKSFADLDNTDNEEGIYEGLKNITEHHGKTFNDDTSDHSNETDYEINDLNELRHHCDTLNEHYYGILGSCDLTELPEPSSTSRFSNCSVNAMIFNYGSETSINTVISNPCSDTSSQHTQNSSECSTNSLSSTMDNSFESSETSFSTDMDDATRNYVTSENSDIFDLKLGILREAERRKKKTSKSSDKSSSSKSSDKSPTTHINLNIRKLLSKLKNRNQDKKTKIKKSKGSISSNSDDSGSITTTIFSASHIEWYTNLFNDCISSDSSDSEDENPNSHKVKKKNIRGKISLDIEVRKQKVTEKGRIENDKYRKQQESIESNHINNDKVKTKGSYANIRKTGTVELQKGVYKNTRRKCVQNENQKNSLNNINTMMRKCEENNNKNENALCRTDMQKIPMIPRFASYTCYDDINSHIRTRPPVHYERRSYSLHEEQYRSSSHESYEEPPKMIASFDFIASEDLEVTVLTGQQVEILVKPDPDWWWVRTPDGKEGFVPKNFLNVIPTVPSRKSDLIKKLMSLTYNPDIDIFDKPDPKPESRNQVRLPTRIKFSDSPRLAKVAPLMREAENTPECVTYESQKDNLHNDINDLHNDSKRLPPPSYTEHINKTLSGMVEKYCDTLDADQSSATRSCNSEESEEDKELSSRPRVLRRRSFSGNKQKKVHFSNKIVTAYLKDSPEYNISDRYGLDINDACSPEVESVSYC